LQRDRQGRKGSAKAVEKRQTGACKLKNGWMPLPAVVGAKIGSDRRRRRRGVQQRRQRRWRFRATAKPRSRRRNLRNPMRNLVRRNPEIQARTLPRWLGLSGTCCTVSGNQSSAQILPQTCYVFRRKADLKRHSASGMMMVHAGVGLPSYILISQWNACK